MDDKTTIAKRLEEFRVAMKLNQKKLAGLLEIQQGSYSDIKRGKVGVSKKIMKKLEFLGLDLDWLLTGRGEMLKNPNCSPPIDNFVMEESSSTLYKSNNIYKLKEELLHYKEKNELLEKSVKTLNELINTKNDLIQQLRKEIETLTSGESENKQAS